MGVAVFACITDDWIEDSYHWMFLYGVVPSRWNTGCFWN
jgi:hypothetical protein